MSNISTRKKYGISKKRYSKKKINYKYGGSLEAKLERSRSTRSSRSSRSSSSSRSSRREAHLEAISKLKAQRSIVRQSRKLKQQLESISAKSKSQSAERNSIRSKKKEKQKKEKERANKEIKSKEKKEEDEKEKKEIERLKKELKEAKEAKIGTNMIGQTIMTPNGPQVITASMMGQQMMMGPQNMMMMPNMTPQQLMMSQQMMAQQHQMPFGMTPGSTAATMGVQLAPGITDIQVDSITTNGLIANINDFKTHDYQHINRVLLDDDDFHEFEKLFNLYKELVTKIFDIKDDFDKKELIRELEKETERKRKQAEKALKKTERERQIELLQGQEERAAREIKAAEQKVDEMRGKHATEMANIVGKRDMTYGTKVPPVVIGTPHVLPNREKANFNSDNFLQNTFQMCNKYLPFDTFKDMQSNILPKPKTTRIEGELVKSLVVQVKGSEKLLPNFIFTEKASVDIKSDFIKSKFNTNPELNILFVLESSENPSIGKSEASGEGDTELQPNNRSELTKTLQNIKMYESGNFLIFVREGTYELNRTLNKKYNAIIIENRFTNEVTILGSMTPAEINDLSNEPAFNGKSVLLISNIKQLTEDPSAETKPDKFGLFKEISKSEKIGFFSLRFNDTKKVLQNDAGDFITQLSFPEGAVNDPEQIAVIEKQPYLDNFKISTSVNYVSPLTGGAVDIKKIKAVFFDFDQTFIDKHISGGECSIPGDCWVNDGLSTIRKLLKLLTAKNIKIYILSRGKIESENVIYSLLKATDEGVAEGDKIIPKLSGIFGSHKDYVDIEGNIKKANGDVLQSANGNETWAAVKTAILEELVKKELFLNKHNILFIDDTPLNVQNAAFKQFMAAPYTEPQGPEVIAPSSIETGTKMLKNIFLEGDKLKNKIDIIKTDQVPNVPGTFEEFSEDVLKVVSAMITEQESMFQGFIPTLA
jgi:hypothetical protein